MKKTTYLKNIFDSRRYQFITFIFLLKPFFLCNGFKRNVDVMN